MNVNYRLISLLSLLGVQAPRVDSDDAAIDLALDAVKHRRAADSDAERTRADALHAAEATAVTEKSRADAAAVSLSAEKSRADAEKGRADALAVEVATMKAAEATRVDAADRASLEPLAKHLRIDSAQHAATQDLKRAIAAGHLRSALRADATDAYVDVVVDMARSSMAVPSHRSDAGGRDAGLRAWETPPAVRTDAKPAPRASAPGCAGYDAAFRAARPQ